MDIQALKIEIVKQIVQSESKELLDKVYNALINKDKADFFLQLTDSQKLEIEIARKQNENGETEELESVLKRLSNKAS